VFAAFGPLNEVTIIRNDAGKSKGFAFVGYTNVFDTAKALKETNSTVINGTYSAAGVSSHSHTGRKIAVDYAIAKDKFQQLSAEDQQKHGKEKSKEDDDTDDDDDDGEASSEGESNVEMEDEPEDADDNDDKEEEASNSRPKPDIKRPPRPSDASLGQTLFVRYG
jgi:nucleolar protein 4